MIRGVRLANMILEKEVRHFMEKRRGEYAIPSPTITVGSVPVARVHMNLALVRPASVAAVIGTAIDVV
jgi:hypothetical protein